MLTQVQIDKLTEAEKLQYDALVAANDTEGIAQFEYFFGFTLGEEEVKIPTNQEIELYKQMTDTIKLKHIAKMLGFIPHAGQQPIFYTLDEQRDIVNNIVMVLGRRAQTLASQIKTPEGFVTFNDVQEGQVICDPYGGTQTVTEVHPIYEGDVYEVSFGDRKVKVDGHHLFTIKEKGEEKVLDVASMYKTFLNGITYSYYMPSAPAVELDNGTDYKDMLKLGKYLSKREKASLRYTPPFNSLQASVQARRALLCSLCNVPLDFEDTLSLELSNKTMTRFVQQLVWSLGYDCILMTSPDKDTLYIKFYETEVPITDIKYLGKQEVRCISVSADHQMYLTDNYILTHNTGKSVSTSVIACRELAVPFSSTILLTPTFNNAKVIFNEVLKNIQKLKIPIKNINRGSFRFELENGARFSANSAANIESALGTYNSLLIVDEAQSVPNLMEIMNQMLVPTLLDYGVRPTGILYGKQVYLGTPRGIDNQLYDLFIKQDEFPNWKSFNAPSTSNPILPASYFEQMKQELGEMLYRQEILAEFFGTDDNVLWAFNKEINLYDDGDFIFNHHMAIVSGLDIGLRDSTAQLWSYRDAQGNYYIDKAYQKNMTSTAQHITNYREIEGEMLSEPEMRYGDPAAAQTLFDYNQDYGYLVHSGNNSFMESLAYINQLLTPTGANQKPRLYINRNLTELIRQMSRVRWKDKVNKSSKDPFIKDPKGTHWDLIAALRYMLYSDSFNMAGSMIISSEA